MSKGFSGMPGNIQGLMKQAQKMQQQMAEIQAEAEQYSAEGSAGGGVVKVVANGKHEILSVTLDPQVVNPAEIEMLQDLFVAATNDALRKVAENLKHKMSAVTGGMGIPGLF
jgi:DNA-binding YbaB/EbfC family protein